MWETLHLNNTLPWRNRNIYSGIMIQEEYKRLIRFLLGLVIATLLLVTYIHQAAQMAVIRSQAHDLTHKIEMVRWENAMLETALAKQTNISSATNYARQVGLTDRGITYYLEVSGVARAETQPLP